MRERAGRAFCRLNLVRIPEIHLAQDLAHWQGKSGVQTQSEAPPEMAPPDFLLLHRRLEAEFLLF